jgi:hypothetical protein
MPEPPLGPGSPHPWLVDVGANENREIQWFADAAAEFLDRAAPTTRSSPTTDGRQRAKPLLALPLVGTGHGGAAARAGQVAAALLPVLKERAMELDVDVVLVLPDRHKFEAVQAVRRGRPPAFAELGDDLIQHARRLAGLASSSCSWAPGSAPEPDSRTGRSFSTGSRG